MQRKKYFWMYPQNSPGYTLGRVRTIDPEWLYENGWGVCLVTSEAMFASTAAFDAYFGPALTLFTQYEIPSLIAHGGFGVSVDHGGYDPTLTTLEVARAKPVSYFDIHAELFTHIEDKWGAGGTSGTILEGYWYEAGVDSWAQWLREFTDLHIQFGIYRDMWTYAGTSRDNSWIGNGAESQEDALARRISMVNGVDIELWQVNGTVILKPLATLLRTTYPSLPIGINSMPFAAPIANGDMGVWTIDSTHPDNPADPFPTIGHAKERFSSAVREIKAEVGAFDVITAQCPDANETTNLTDITTPTWWSYQQGACRYWDEKALTSTPYKELIIYDLKENGRIPDYVGGGQCAASPIISDTFANTGNELILLKDVGTASTHDITVTSTDTLTHEDYAIACSPDRGTFIGPYTLDTYGALPTITYDTTNLYVSVLKVEPTA